MRDERFIRNIQRVFALLPSAPHIKRVLSGERLSLEAQVLHDDFGAHLAPGTNRGAANVGAGATALTRLALRRFGGTPSAASTTIKLVTKILIP